jgi:hypothetical protein
MRKAATLVLFTVLMACTNTTGVLPAGPGTFSVTDEYSTMRGGEIAAKREAYEEAADFCANKSGDLLPVKSEPKEVRGQDSTMFTLTFQCVPSKDTKFR